jgi:hypothetical protein
MLKLSHPAWRLRPAKLYDWAKNGACETSMNPLPLWRDHATNLLYWVSIDQPTFPFSQRFEGGVISESIAFDVIFMDIASAKYQKSETW